MTHTEMRALVAPGPAIGTTGAVGAGLSVSAGIPKEKYLGTVAVSVRTREMSVPIRRGQVYVELAVVAATTPNQAPSDGNDPLNDAPVVWHSGAYVWTGKGATFHPNIFAGENSDGLRIVARCWNRDNLNASRIVSADVAVVFSSRPVAGNDDFDSEGWGPRIVISADPAAGAEPSITVPVGIEQKVSKAQFTLVADAGVANRVPVLLVTRGAVTIVSDAQSFSIASQTRIYSWANHETLQGITDKEFKTSWHGVALLGGDVITVDIVNIQAGDDATGLILECEERVVPAMVAV